MRLTSDEPDRVRLTSDEPDRVRIPSEARPLGAHARPAAALDAPKYGCSHTRILSTQSMRMYISAGENRARLLHEMSPADCRRRQHVVAVMSTASFAVCVCVCTGYDEFYQVCPTLWHVVSVERRRRPRHGPTAHIGSIRIRHRHTHRTRRRRTGGGVSRYFVRVSFSARPLAPRRRASRSSGGDARRHARNNGSNGIMRWVFVARGL